MLLIQTLKYTQRFNHSRFSSCNYFHCQSIHNINKICHHVFEVTVKFPFSCLQLNLMNLEKSVFAAFSRRSRESPCSSRDCGCIRVAEVGCLRCLSTATEPGAPKSCTLGRVHKLARLRSNTRNRTAAVSRPIELKFNLNCQLTQFDKDVKLTQRQHN